jgi:hypothetical protein
MAVTSDADTKPDRFQTAMAIMIALVTLFGAALASRTALVGVQAGDEDFYGLTATLNAEETKAVNTTTLYGNYRAYTAYTRYNELGNLISADLDEVADAQEREALTRQMNAAWSLAVAVNYFFPTRYLNRDGGYDTERELGEAWAEAASQKDLYPEPHFALADSLRAKVSRLLIIIIILTAAVWFFTLAQSLRHVIRYVCMLGGLGLTMLGVAMAVLEEVFVRGGRLL